MEGPGVARNFTFSLVSCGHNIFIGPITVRLKLRIHLNSYVKRCIIIILCFHSCRTNAGNHHLIHGNRYIS